MGEGMKQKYIVAHFDGHGVATASARARSLRIQPENVYAKFPETGPEQLPNFIDTYFPTLSSRDVEIIDIPVNLKDPRAFIDAINRLARNTTVTIHDHHDTDMPFVAQLLSKIVIYRSAVHMAEVLADENNRELAYVGVVADRDPGILNIYNEHEVNSRLLPLANRLDIIVRKDALTAVRSITAEGLAYIERFSEPYPPERLASQVTVLRRGYNTLLVDATAQAQQISQWVWKVLEQVALLYRADYVVAVTQSLDRQTNQWVPTVHVVKYWLSRRPSPRRSITPIEGRQTIGHDDAFSIRAISLEDARNLAERVFSDLEAMSPRTVTLINEKNIAEAVRADYNAILQKLTEILDSMRTMYSEYLRLKEEQVRLLRSMSTQTTQTSTRERVRAD